MICKNHTESRLETLILHQQSGYKRTHICPKLGSAGVLKINEVIVMWLCEMTVLDGQLWTC